MLVGPVNGGVRLLNEWVHGTSADIAVVKRFGEGGFVEAPVVGRKGG